MALLPWQCRKELCDEDGAPCDEDFSPKASVTPLLPPLPQRRHGDIGGDYEFGRRLGQGGFSVVSKAKCTQTGQAVAIKRMLLSSFANEPSRLTSELSVAAAVRHPHIAQLFEFYSDNFEVYMVMEVCTGGELFDLVQPTGVDEGLVRTYAWQMLSAVGYLHTRGIAHRDVKTENFLLQSNAPGAPLKLIDFGVSRSYTPGVPMTTMVGTICYLAPEMFRNSYGELVDVWAVGVAVYLLLSGSYPFMGSSEASTARRIRKGCAAFPRKTWSGVSSWAVDFVGKLLTCDDQVRPSAHEAMRDAWLKAPRGADIEFRHELAARHRKFAASPWPLQVAMAVAARHVPEAQARPLASMFARRCAAESHRSALRCESAPLLSGGSLSSRTYGSRGSELRRALEAGEVDYATWLAASLGPGFFSQPGVVKAAVRALCPIDEGRISRSALARVARALAPSLARAAGAPETGPDVEVAALEAALAAAGASGKSSAAGGVAEFAGMLDIVRILRLESPKVVATPEVHATPQKPRCVAQTEGFVGGGGAHVDLKRDPSLDFSACSTTAPSLCGEFCSAADLCIQEGY